MYLKSGKTTGLVLQNQNLNLHRRRVRLGLDRDSRFQPQGAALARFQSNEPHEAPGGIWPDGDVVRLIQILKECPTERSDIPDTHRFRRCAHGLDRAVPAQRGLRDGLRSGAEGFLVVPVREIG